MRPWITLLPIIALSVASCGNPPSPVADSGAGLIISDGSRAQSIESFRPGMKAVPSGVPTVEPDSSEIGDLGGQETVVLFGDAALYHLYSESKIERLNGKNPQLPVQLSRDGRAYVRESDGSIRWLVAPDVGVRVPKRWGQRYRDFAGFEGRENGRTLKGFVTGIQD